MGFEKIMDAAEQYLVMTPRFIDPSAPQGLWFCDSVATVSDIQINAVALRSGCDWDDVAKCRPFLEFFPFIVIVSPNAIACEQLVQELRPRLPASCVYVAQDAGFRNCKTIRDYIRNYGERELLAILEGAVELPAFGILNLADVKRRDFSSMSRTLSGFKRLDSSIGGFFGGELSVWTGKRGSGKSTLLGQMLLEAVEQGHKVCAYSGELPAEQFRLWIYLQAAGPQHIVYKTDEVTGKRLAEAEMLADKHISEWIDERFWLFDLERNTSHDIDSILSQFEYAHMRYGADVFLVDNIMAVDLKMLRESDYYRAQSDFVRRLSLFSKKHRVHVHLVAHPRKSGGGKQALTNDDVGGTGDITNRADNVFSLSKHMREVDGQTEEKPLLTILKNRDFGASGDIWLDFDKKSRRFFHSKTGDPNKYYSWHPSAQQLRLIEDQYDIDSVFPEEPS